MNLGPGTMGLWVNTIGAEKLPPLIALLHEAALAEPVLHCDETTVQVLKSEKAPTTDHYMIVRVAGSRASGSCCSIMPRLATSRRSSGC